MSGKNKKKIGYKQYENLLVVAHKKSDILAQRLQALQSYIVSYIEYKVNMKLLLAMFAVAPSRA